MITGDKQATAIEIGYSCRLLKQDMDIIILNARDSEDCGEQLRAKVRLNSLSLLVRSSYTTHEQL